MAARQTPTGLEKAGVLLSGVLPQSTVSAGESEALIQLLKCLDVQVDVTSDSKVALRQLRSWNFGVQTYLSWSQVWEKRHLLAATWVRSHRNEQAFLEEFGQASLWRRQLNDWADAEGQTGGPGPAP